MEQKGTDGGERSWIFVLRGRFSAPSAKKTAFRVVEKTAIFEACFFPKPKISSKISAHFCPLFLGAAHFYLGFERFLKKNLTRKTLFGQKKWVFAHFQKQKWAG